MSNRKFFKRVIQYKKYKKRKKKYPNISLILAVSKKVPHGIAWPKAHILIQPNPNESMCRKFQESQRVMCLKSIISVIITSSSLFQSYKVVIPTTPLQIISEKKLSFVCLPLRMLMFFSSFQWHYRTFLSCSVVLYKKEHCFRINQAMGERKGRGREGGVDLTPLFARNISSPHPKPCASGLF